MTEENAEHRVYLVGDYLVGASDDEPGLVILNTPDQKEHRLSRDTALVLSLALRVAADDARGTGGIEPLADLRRVLADAAQFDPLPWSVHDHESVRSADEYPIGEVSTLSPNEPLYVPETARMIVAVVNALPALLDRLEAAEGLGAEADQ